MRAWQTFASVQFSDSRGGKTLFKGGFPLSRNFYVRTDVNFNWLYVRKLK